MTDAMSDTTLLLLGIGSFVLIAWLGFLTIVVCYLSKESKPMKQQEKKVG